MISQNILKVHKLGLLAKHLPAEHELIISLT